MWQAHIFGMHSKHGGKMFYDELAADSMIEATDYFLDHKRDDVNLVRLGLIEPDERSVRE